jgi:hypothetical protein
VRVVTLTFAAVALALVILPAEASGESRVPAPVCPPDLTLAGLEQAPGAVIFSGTVIMVAPDAPRVRFAVVEWYHRSRVPGLEQGHHPATMTVFVGSSLGRAGRVIPARMPQVGSRFLVAGTWPDARRDVSVACGILANANDPAGAQWIDEADARYAPVAPSAIAADAAASLDEPWMIMALTVAGLLFAATVLEAIADATDPLPLT